MNINEQDTIINDPLNLRILARICKGEGISFNISQLSAKLNRHRSTIKKRIENLLKYNIIDPPVCPFLYLYREYPLFVIVFADFPNTKQINNWISSDKQIFAAYNVREEEYNVMLIEFHKSLTHYQKWREELITKGKIPSRETRRASTSLFFSNDLRIKYEPEVSINILEEMYYERKKHDLKVNINDYSIDKLDLDIIRCLLKGVGIKTNENLLSKQLNSHRKTIENRIKKLKGNEIILEPRCQFPQFFLPSNLLLVFSLLDLRDGNNKIFEILKQDNHIPVIFKVSIGKYNCLMFSVHESIDKFLAWNIEYREEYPNVFGIEKINYLSPRMTTFINLQKVSLGVINEKLGMLRRKK
ncbi:MAG: hypothetical protein ACTSRS_13785 [Candidatus Helarchaeota archaeon]